MIAENVLAQVIIEWSHAPYGQKRHTIDRWAEVLGVEYKKIYRAIQKAVGRKKKERSDKGKRENPQREEWTRIVWGIKNRTPKDCDAIATDQAITSAVRSGAIPAEATRIPVSSFNRVARELGLNRTKGRYRRNQAKYANLKHVFDASTSKYLYIDRRTPDGKDYILKLHTPSQNYKNKPIPCDRLRPWIYGLVDDNSGMFYAECVAAKGESAADGMIFLQHAWAKKENASGLGLSDAIRLRGLPKLLYLDLGPIAKAPPVAEFFDRLDVKMIKGQPGNAKARGKIERIWRTIFSRFGLPFFTADDWKKFEITLSEYNRQLQNFLIEYNARPHRYQKQLSREAVWWNSINERGGLVDISREAFRTVFQRHRRMVDGGYFSLANKLYEVTGFDNGWVHVYEGVFDDRLVVECIKTHRKYEVKLFVPQTWGQKIELVKSQAEQLAEESRENISITDTYYQQAPDTKIAKLPVRGEIKVIDDPLIVPSLSAQEGEYDNGATPLFKNDADHYEHIIKLRAQGGSLSSTNINFMKYFEKTGTYRELASTFRRWENFYEKQAADGGNR